MILIALMAALSGPVIGAALYVLLEVALSSEQSCRRSAWSVGESK
jgi:hypothetical protein